jgi:hypothetical protein
MWISGAAATFPYAHGCISASHISTVAIRDRQATTAMAAINGRRCQMKRAAVVDRLQWLIAVQRTSGNRTELPLVQR